MLKRRSTLDSTEKARRNRQTEYCLDLDKCLQIPHDQRLLLRRQIKDSHPELMALFDQYKRDRNLGELQMKLRRFLQRGQRQPTQTSERKQTEPAQRVYSQHSQNGSFRNSAKASPEKEEPKRKTITFDISQLQRKVEQVERHRDRDGSVRTGKEGSASQRELSLSKEKRVAPLNSCSSTKSSLKVEADFSKVTLRVKQPPAEAMKARQAVGGGVNEGRKTPLEEIGNSISYSSSIRNMLICKLKEKEQVKENRIVLKPRVSKEAKPMQNSIVDNSAEVKAKEKEEAREREVRQEKEAAKREVHEEKPYRRDTIRQDKLQSSLTSSLKDTECTVSKKAPKPIQRDEMQCSVRLFDDSIPMYLKSSQLEDNIFTNRRPPRLETEDQDDSAKFGQFYKRIRNIIEGDCC